MEETIVLLILVGAFLIFGLAKLVGLWRKRSGRRKTALDANLQWMIVDGSNVMHWKDGTPQLSTVREVVDHLTAKGFSPGVVFDANAGYLLSGRYRHDASLSRALNLPEARVMVVPKGTPADAAILKAARDLKARVVTNDRFRDWADEYPEVHHPNHLVRGGYRAGRLYVNLNRTPKKKGSPKTPHGSGGPHVSERRS